MALPELIRDLNLQNGTAAAAKAVLEAKTIEKTDSNRKTYSDIARRYGDNVIDDLDVSLKNVGKEWIRLALSGIGFDFTDSSTIARIFSLRDGGIISEDRANKLLELGVWMESPLQNAGLGTTVTLAQVTAAQNVVKTQDKILLFQTLIDERATDVKNRVATGELTTQAQVLAALGASV